MKLAEIDISSIEPGSRAREDFGDIEELAQDIKDNELINPITVMAQEGDKPYKLLAGERRLRACLLLGLPTVPVRIYDNDPGPIQIKVIELSENLKRKNFTALEEVLIKKQIHLLQMEIHGPKRERTPDAPGWSMRDTANLLGESPASISQDLALADAIEEIPELLQAKNKNEAKKLLDKMLKIESDRSMAEAIQAKDTEVKDNIFKTITDCFLKLPFEANMSKIPDNKADFIFLQDSALLKPSFAQDLIRIMSGNSWLLIMCPEDVTKPGVGYRFEGLPIKFVQQVFFLLSGTERNERPDITLSKCVKTAMLYRKGNPSLNSAHSDAFSYEHNDGDFKVSLYGDLTTTFCYTGSTAIFPDMTSGNPILGAANSGIKSIGYCPNDIAHNDFIVRAHQGKPGDYR